MSEAWLARARETSISLVANDAGASQIGWKFYELVATTDKTLQNNPQIRNLNISQQAPCAVQRTAHLPAYSFPEPYPGPGLSAVSCSPNCIYFRS